MSRHITALNLPTSGWLPQSGSLHRGLVFVHHYRASAVHWMMENSTHRALLLPEIVHDILVHVDQRTLVHSTSFVNRLFNDETSAVLWRNPFFDVPTVLDSVEDIERGQHLANRIQSMTLRMNILNEDQFDNLMRFSYPSLEHLNVVDLERSEEPVNIERLFEKIPNLLSYKDSNPTRATLRMLEHWCPKLTRLTSTSVTR
ncbi:hypothetical protein D6D00_05622 [Aureobasidium pullulans]|nr:hypothetical protein D6D00_05622 [Aureobasidium pullulans]